jgi:hypothetical protein
MNDWPDRYIHTNADVPANIDSTKLARVAFLAAASGYVLSRITPKDTDAIHELLAPFALERRAAAMRRQDPNVLRFNEWYEHEMLASVDRFFKGEHPIVQRRVKGPMSAFGYDYFDAHYKGSAIRLPQEMRYEALNLADGKRTPTEIRDALAAIYGAVSLEDVAAYLQALESIGVIERTR